MKHLLLLLTLLAAATASPIDVNRYWRQLEPLSTDSIKSITSRCLQGAWEPDSAMVCLSVIVSRYDPSLSLEQKKTVVEALSLQWMIYSVAWFNQAKGFECLARADDICRREGIDDSNLKVKYAMTYQELAELTDDPELYAKAYEALLEAFPATVKQTGADVHDVFINLVTVAAHLGRMPQVAKAYGMYLKMDTTGYDDYQLQRRRLDILNYEGHLLMAQGRYREAATVFERHKITPHEGGEWTQSNFLLRFHIQLAINCAEALMRAGDTGQAKHELLEALALTRQWKQPDAAMQIHRVLAEVCERAGDAQGASASRIRYLTMKDSLLNYQQISAIKDTDSLYQLQRKDEEITEERRTRQAQGIWLWASVIVALTAIGAFFLVRRKNRILARTNDSLYRRIMQSIDAPAPAPPTPAAPAPDSSTPPEAQPDTELMEQVRVAMTRDGAVFDPAFCAQRLEELTGINYKYLSAAINQCTGAGLTALVNDYRVREACRLLSDVKVSGTYTVEAIGQRVGYASRQTFFRVFKQSTGMTPSQFRASAQRTQTSREA